MGHEITIEIEDEAQYESLQAVKDYYGMSWKSLLLRGQQAVLATAPTAPPQLRDSAPPTATSETPADAPDEVGDSSVFESESASDSEPKSDFRTVRESIQQLDDGDGVVPSAVAADTGMALNKVEDVVTQLRQDGDIYKTGERDGETVYRDVEGVMDAGDPLDEE